MNPSRGYFVEGEAKEGKDAPVLLYKVSHLGVAGFDDCQLIVHSSFLTGHSSFAIDMQAACRSKIIIAPAFRPVPNNIQLRSTSNMRQMHQERSSDRTSLVSRHVEHKLRQMKESDPSLCDVPPIVSYETFAFIV